MKFIAIILLLSFSILFSFLYKITKTTTDLIFVTLLLIGIVIFSARRMTWIYTSLSRSFDNESQKCLGWEITETACFGIVQDRY